MKNMKEKRRSRFSDVLWHLESMKYEWISECSIQIGTSWSPRLWKHLSANIYTVQWFLTPLSKTQSNGMASGDKTFRCFLFHFWEAESLGVVIPQDPIFKNCVLKKNLDDGGEELIWSLCYLSFNFHFMYNMLSPESMHKVHQITASQWFSPFSVCNSETKPTYPFLLQVKASLYPTGQWTHSGLPWKRNSESRVFYWKCLARNCWTIKPGESLFKCLLTSSVLGRKKKWRR